MIVERSTVAAGNEEQFAAWNGEEGERWAANPAYYDAAARHHHRLLMQAAAIGADDRVLDVGCGTGQCTREAARLAPLQTAVGIDLSLPLVGVAERLAARDGLSNVVFVHGDAQVYGFEPGGFDVVLSRFGSMFFDDQIAAFTNIGRAVRPGGRLAAVSWRSAAENDWISTLRRALVPGAPPPEATTNAPGAFRHSDADDTYAILAASGYDDIGLDRVDVPIHLGRDADEAFTSLRPLFAWMVDDGDAAAAALAFERMRAELDAHETTEGVTFGSAAWLITARRSKRTGIQRGAGS
jgi:SAM-dependent methyltransferase